MAKRTFFVIVCVVLSVSATAWAQGPGYALQGPYGPPAGPWVGGPGEAQAAQPGAMQAGPAPQSAANVVAMGDPCCVDNQPIPKWESFGDFLYMRPRNANVAYGVVYNNTLPDTPPVQLSQPGVASIDYHPGLRVGIAKSLDECNAVVATFLHYEGENRDSISTTQDLIRSMVSHPISPIVIGDWAQAASDYSMISSVADVDFRWTFENQNDTRLSLLGGIRYASLDQRLDVTGTTPFATDIESVHSQVNFEGGGLRIGFEGQRRTPLGIVFYGRAAASVVAGTFRCAYTDTSGLNGPVVNTGYPADRVVPMIDAELGAGLSLRDDKLRLTAGYSFSGWFNMVRTDQFIGAVQANNFTGMHDTLTFDGFVGRVELQF